jgi:hypothetical protein
LTPTIYKLPPHPLYSLSSQHSTTLDFQLETSQSSTHPQKHLPNKQLLPTFIMKFTIFIIAAMATVSMANPLSAPTDAMSASAAKVVGRDDCQTCHDFYNKCRGVSKSHSNTFL